MNVTLGQTIAFGEPPVGHAKPFTEMADRILKIDPAEFAGAIVVVPPGDGEPIAFLTTDPKPDIMQFWATVKSRIEVRGTEAMQAAANQQDPWGGRR
jgi:hypothetical protein